MHETISELGDDTAIRVLAVLATAEARDSGAGTALTPALRAALARDFAVAGATRPVADGDAARLALTLLAADPDRAARIELLATGPRPERFEIAATIGLIGAILFALQTHVEFTRHKDGSYSVKIKKEPTKDGLLKPLIEKLVSYLP